MGADTRVEALETVGTHVLRYGLVLLSLMWGAAKFTAFEADAIKPLVEHSPGDVMTRSNSALDLFDVVLGKWTVQSQRYAEERGRMTAERIEDGAFL